MIRALVFSFDAVWGAALAVLGTALGTAFGYGYFRTRVKFEVRQNIRIGCELGAVCVRLVNKPMRGIYFALAFASFFYIDRTEGRAPGA